MLSGKYSRLGSAYDWMKKLLLHSGFTLRFLVEIFLDALLVTFINFTQFTLNFWTAACALILLFVSVGLLAVVVYARFACVKEEDEEESSANDSELEHEAPYPNYRLKFASYFKTLFLRENRQSTVYPLIFLLRRLAFAATLVFMTGHPTG